MTAPMGLSEDELRRAMTVGELIERLRHMPADMPVVMRISVRDDEEIAIEGGDSIMGDLRTADIEVGCGSAPPVLLLDGDREPSRKGDGE